MFLPVIKNKQPIGYLSIHTFYNIARSIHSLDFSRFKENNPRIEIYFYSDNTIPLKIIYTMKLNGYYFRDTSSQGTRMFALYDSNHKLKMMIIGESNTLAESGIWSFVSNGIHTKLT